MKILFLSANRYIPQMFGGSQSSTHDLCRGLMGRGHSVTVLAALAKGDEVVTQGGILGLNIGKNAATPIENAASDYLIGLGCALQQGYLHGRPMPAPDLLGLMARRESESEALA